MNSSGKVRIMFVLYGKGMSGKPWEDLSVVLYMLAPMFTLFISFSVSEILGVKSHLPCK